MLQIFGVAGKPEPGFGQNGPLAQRLYVFKKDSSGALILAYDWAASTGREQYEIAPSGAGAGSASGSLRYFAGSAMNLLRQDAEQNE